MKFERSSDPIGLTATKFSVDEDLPKNSIFKSDGSITDLSLNSLNSTARSLLVAYSKFTKLSNVKIAQLNGIKLPSNQHNITIYENLRSQFQRYPGGFNTTMTESEALEILDIKGEEIMKLDKDKLKRKHRQCMIQNHPDKGGSPYLSMKFNEAKEILEKSYMFRNKDL
ncbi:hypothetical protein WICMUC_003465 [Wickerhamomyces mucosus]|uniref:J domain-containing protein n=1 Tax=Wickerhamomyces mucosus TaxID=1378264 RepID=A0A9P8TCA4_9ASCO|nr:hypothetical protein WICMUC_003465 [Wickerhamomyces mucosus]